MNAALFRMSLVLAFVSLFLPENSLRGEVPPGMISVGDRVAYPLGSYEIPASDEELARMAKAGFNLLRCNQRKDLDRVGRLGIKGWIPLPLHAGATEALKQQILEVRDHPALAVWEGPDEVVWNFTAYSGLKKTAGFSRQDWHDQKPNAVEYARREGVKVMQNMHQAMTLIRELDPHRRPIWINEAADSDVIYVRQYMDAIDLCGCDYYPVKHDRRVLSTIGRVTDRWKLTGQGKPVWMVLQAFSWHKGEPSRYTHVAYPSFGETRFMAYSVILHEGRGVLYWGSQTIDLPPFRESLYAIARELSALQPFLVSPPIPGPAAQVIDADLDNSDVKLRDGVRVTLRSHGEDQVLMVINEDDVRHLAVDIKQLPLPDGRTLHRLYADEQRDVSHGQITVRLQPYDVQVWSTSRQFETPDRTGRDFQQPLQK